MKLTEQEILKIQPLSSKIGKIDAAFSLKTSSAISGESFRIIASNKNYKLRCCDSEAAADKIRNNISKLPKYFPKFIGQEGRFILFDWIDADILENYTVQDCYFIGKMMGEAHQLGDVLENADPDPFFNERIERLKQVFDNSVIEKIIKKYDEFKKKLKIDVVLEFNDVHQSNFIKDKDGTIYYVDEEGFSYRIKGLGFAKPMLTSKWMKTQQERDAFWKGYNEHHSSDYFDADYQKFIYFVQLVRTIAVRTETGADYSKEKLWLLEIL